MWGQTIALQLQTLNFNSHALWSLRKIVQYSFWGFIHKARVWFCSSGAYNPICIYCSAHWSEFAWQPCVTSHKLRTHLISFSFQKTTVSFNVNILPRFLNESEFLTPILKDLLLNLPWSMMNNKSGTWIKLTYRRILLLMILILLDHFSIVQKHLSLSALFTFEFIFKILNTTWVVLKFKWTRKESLIHV